MQKDYIGVVVEVLIQFNHYNKPMGWEEAKNGGKWKINVIILMEGVSVL